MIHIAITYRNEVGIFFFSKLFVTVLYVLVHLVYREKYIRALWRDIAKNLFYMQILHTEVRT